MIIVDALLGAAGYAIMEEARKRWQRRRILRALEEAYRDHGQPRPIILPGGATLRVWRESNNADDDRGLGEAEGL